MIPSIIGITDDERLAVVEFEGQPWIVEIEGGFASALHDKPRLSRSEARRFIWTKSNIRNT